VIHGSASSRTRSLDLRITTCRSPLPRGRGQAPQVLLDRYTSPLRPLLAPTAHTLVDAARVGSRAITELWPRGTEALALAMESLGPGGQAPSSSGGAAAVVAAAGRLGRPVDPAPGRRADHPVGGLTVLQALNVHDIRAGRRCR
jgi:hypothetical protein